MEKHHNPELLNAIIDKHNHVKRESVKELFHEQSNKEVLQALFSKTSTIDPQKLRELLNDPDSAHIINSLANAEEGIVAP